ncbi:hypothetical protein [Rhodococcus sp. H29-C3]|uniref:hypothetical protein n=1 Tax=Rhodococcus sp. H29-C3 TaxID=3046307 RepID=UPI0024B8989F|nr:hypothetical protein [Rhodococcus sp. H29-C3]MDJ0363109.1 hypothetical protein [Rhodococcus sp. H29-C3]
MKNALARSAFSSRSSIAQMWLSGPTIWRKPEAAKAWVERLLSVESTEPIAFRPQNYGDYEIPSLQLKDGLESAGRTGFGLHVRG